MKKDISVKAKDYSINIISNGIENFENIVEGVGLGLNLGNILFLQRLQHHIGRMNGALRGDCVGNTDGICHLVEAGGDDGHTDLVVQILVEGSTEDGESVGMDGLLHQRCGLLHFLQTDVHGTGNVDQDTGCKCFNLYAVGSCRRSH